MASLQIALSDLRPGQRAVIRSFIGESEMHLRLLELGLIPGTEIECVRTAPFGDPLEVSVRGYCLSLRLGEASSIAVDPA